MRSLYHCELRERVWVKRCTEREHTLEWHCCYGRSHDQVAGDSERENTLDFTGYIAIECLNCARQKKCVHHCCQIVVN